MLTIPIVLAGDIYIDPVKQYLAEIGRENLKVRARAAQWVTSHHLRVEASDQRFGLVGQA
jgi:hypothetical protein